ncbi:hypothetical protein GQ44DRAFT_714477 [Phaeosphaeriaceae sp. PMI808]|nr:hypothetical protein GQ44DRAFT_714477 [Phaeosphaeriaceae sp. PMI808]
MQGIKRTMLQIPHTPTRCLQKGPHIPRSPHDYQCHLQVFSKKPPTKVPIGKGKRIFKSNGTHSCMRPWTPRQERPIAD